MATERVCVVDLLGPIYILSNILDAAAVLQKHSYATSWEERPSKFSLSAEVKANDAFLRPIKRNLAVSEP